MGVLFWLSVAWVVFISVGGFIAGLLPLEDPINGDLDKIYRPMFSDDALLGTDSNGRDLLSRVMHGAGVSLKLAYIAPFFSLFFGLCLGISAGYFRGRVDTIISIFIDSILAFPNIVAIIALLFYLGATPLNMILVFSFFGIPLDTRVARANAIMFAERDFVMAARAQGASHLRIMFRELLPNVVVPLLSLVIFHMAIIIVIDGVLSFLGVGIPPPTPTWGKMIADGFEDISREPQAAFVPSAAMFLTILSMNMIGDRLRQLTDVKASSV
jgi:peptide/nickel transport system permease protein